VLLLLALLYFDQTLRELRYANLERDPMFLYAVAAVVMYALRPVATGHVNWLLLSIHFLFQTVWFCLLAHAFCPPRAESTPLRYRQPTSNRSYLHQWIVVGNLDDFHHFFPRA